MAKKDDALKRRLRIAKLRARMATGEPLDAFIRRVSPERPPPAHFAPVLAQLERAARGKSKVRVLLSMPPRHGKTTLIQHAIAWWLTRYPGETCAYASYSDRQAWSKSRGTREIAARAGIVLASDAANLAEWRTLYGGGLLSVGAGSGLTGQGVSGLMVVDDPFKNQEEAQSSVTRDKVGDWFDSVVRTRIEGAAVFVIHTRWHEDDLIGRLTDDPGFVYINLPALAEANDPIGRAEGELLWPERIDLAESIKESKAANAWMFEALYQGRPRPRGDTVFGDPHYYDPETTDFQGTRFVLAADPAASEKTSADFSAAVVLSVQGTGEAMKAYVRHVYRAQVSVPQFAQDLLGLQQRFGETRINVESVGAFKAIPQMLRAIRPGIRVNEIVPIGDKFMRAQPAASAWNSARILVPSDSPPWLGPFLDEIALFTGVKDAHDDQVDALAHAWNSGPKLSIFDVL
jgi:predicted phage terminase large subunit-like protein